MLTQSSSIQVEHLCKSYSKAVFSDVSFSIAQGEAVGLIGPNGAGKSTLIKILLGLVKADKGKATLFGDRVDQISGHKKVSYLPELPGFWSEVSAYEYLSFTRDLQLLISSRSVEELLRLVGLKERGRRPMGTYSKGMIQRVGIAWALQREPELYILDEPMSGLDPRAQTMLKEVLLEERAKGRTLLISSHSYDDIRQLCNRVIVINEQKLVYDGDPETAFKKLQSQFIDIRSWDQDYE